MIARAVTVIIRLIFREVILQGRWAAVVHTQGALCCFCPRAPRIWSSTQGNKESLRSKWAKHKTPTIWYGLGFPKAGRVYLPGLSHWKSNNSPLNCLQLITLNRIGGRCWGNYRYAFACNQAIRHGNIWDEDKRGGVRKTWQCLVMGWLPESQRRQVRAQHIWDPFKTLPGWVNSCRLELEINYSASTSSLSLWIGFSVLTLAAHFSWLAVSN